MAATYQIDTSDKAKRWARDLYWGPMPLPGELVGAISGSGGSGILMYLPKTGAYVRGNAGALSSVDRSKVRAILGVGPDTDRVAFRLGRETLEGLARIAEARGLIVGRGTAKGEPNRTEALRQIVIEELERIGS